MTVTATSAPVVTREVSKSFGTVQALRGVSLEVPSHSIFGVLGPNGAGKTTLFSILTGFILPGSGSVSVLGTDRLDSVRGRLSILPQDALFQSNIPIIDQLSFFLTLMGWERAAAEPEVLRVLELVDLADVVFREAATLSHGMYKRLALAQAFLGKPEVIILDEPTAGLDFKSAASVRSAIKRLQQDATVMVSSHDLEEMHELCDHVAILDKGELVASGPVDSVTGGAYVVQLSFDRPADARELERLRSIGGVTELAENEQGYELLLHGEDAPDDRTADRIVSEVLKVSMGLGLCPRQLTRENRLKRLYVSVTR
jgi:ABC-2 type transport system ATP-binding protein